MCTCVGISISVCCVFIWVHVCLSICVCICMRMLASEYEYTVCLWTCACICVHICFCHNTAVFPPASIVWLLHAAFCFEYTRSSSMHSSLKLATLVYWLYNACQIRYSGIA